MKMSAEHSPKAKFNKAEYNTPFDFHEKATGLLPGDRSQIPWMLFEYFYYTLGYPGVQGYAEKVLTEYTNQK
jgi:hypothetical protein